MATVQLTLPTGREEAWRFTPLQKVISVLDGSVSAGSTIVRNIISSDGVKVHRENHLSPIVVPEDFAAALTLDKSPETLIIEIPVEYNGAEPIVIDRTGSSLSSVNFERIQVRAGRHSQASIVVHNSGSALLAEDIELELAEGAHLTFISLQEWENDATHLGRHQAVIGKDAKLTLIEVTLGGSIVRLLPRVNFLDTGGEIDAFGLYFATSGQHLEHQIGRAHV